MGLFGGFKAKFTRNSTSKEKPQDVVCLKYHVHSEFDSQDPALPVPNNIKKNEVIRRQSKTKTRKALAKSAIFQETNTADTSLASPDTPQKSQSMLDLNGNASDANNKHRELSDYLTVSTTLPVSSNTSSVANATAYDRNARQHNGMVVENVAIVTNKHTHNSSNKIKTEKHKKAVLSTFSAHLDDNQASKTSQSSNFLYMTKETTSTQPIKPILKVNRENQKNLDNEQSTLIFMTQHSEQPASSDKTVENGEDDFGAIFARSMPSRQLINNDEVEEEQGEDNGNLTFVQNKTTDDDFYVNLVKHDRTYSQSEYSEDERSYDDEKSYVEDQPQSPHKFTKMGYSSQAASIFFGEDVAPEINRPRRVLLTEDEDDRRSSGADC